ncbi:MAG: hypothetical protein M3N17_02790 [Actinomycetota bacterium]|nr:hypothetical protein [Actinomycetota bacterium]
MAQRVAELDVRVDAGPNADPEEVAEATAQLRKLLLELDVEAVDAPSAGEAPPGTRSVETMAVGTLIVSLVNSSGLLSSVVASVQSWLSRLGRHSVKLELDGDVLEVTGISKDEQRKLITHWIDRHSDR